MLFEGNMNRVIAEHTLNTHSSRSHCIFTIHVESHSRTHSNAEYNLSKLNLVDLAGSERLSKTNVSQVTTHPYPQLSAPPPLLPPFLYSPQVSPRKKPCTSTNPFPFWNR